jgi:tartronate-semialdehyde synthase
VAVAEGLGCKAIRVKSPNEFKEAFARAEALMAEHQVPVVLEFILERVTNIAMGTEITNVNEFEEILCLDPSLTPENGWTPAGARSLQEHLSEERVPAE